VANLAGARMAGRMLTIAGADAVTRIDGGQVPTSLVADTVDDLLRHAIRAVIDDGETNVAKRGSTKEIIGAALEIRNPRARLSQTEKRRRTSSVIAELCWYLRGTNEAQPITFWIPKYANEVEADGTIHGGYGPRLFGDGADAQVRNITELLKDNPSTRRAVIQLFDRADLLAKPRYLDVPCTCTIHFLLRNDFLNVVVNMRSNDVYVGLPHDIFAFTMLQEIVARELDVEIGRYIHMVGSLHMYSDNEDDAEQFLSEGWQSTDRPMPPMPAGRQWPHVETLLHTESQVRDGVSYFDLDMPQNPYWADLARALAHRVAVRAGDVQLAQTIAQGFVDDAFANFS
jgi:thymidylate synthase